LSPNNSKTPRAKHVSLLAQGAREGEKQNNIAINMDCVLMHSNVDDIRKS
jgi:hypothetical protein